MVKSIRALDRGLEVLDRVREGDGVTLKHLFTRTGLPRATLLRILKTLEEREWIQLGLVGGHYHLGPKMFEPVRVRGRGRSLAELAVPVLNALAKKVIWPSDVAVCRGHSMLILESSRRNAPFVINHKALGRRPCLLKSAMGRAYLAFCPKEEREQLLEALRRSTHPDDKSVAMQSWVDRVLRQTRAQGYGVREPGYWAGPDDFGDEVSSFAVPVMTGQKVIGCINLIWVTSAGTVEAFARMHLDVLKEAAVQLARSAEAQRVELE
jgi:IclR family transcriptional regulator, mhp operon transcriptional activator